MQLSQLRNFMAVIEHGAISKAAEKLDVAQPALSQSISRMEKRLGVVLFERSRRGALPTIAARAIVDDVRHGLSKLEEAGRKARATQAGRAGTLKIGLVSSALFDVLPDALKKIRRLAPDLALEFLEMGNDEQAEALKQGIIDVGLIHSPIAIGGRMHQKILRQDKLIAAVPSRLAKSRGGKITLQEMAECGLVLYPKEQFPHMYFGIAEAIRKQGCEFKINQHANRTMTVLACVSGDLGIGMLPSWIRSMGFPGVDFCQIDNGQDLPSFDLLAVAAPQYKAMLDYF